MTGQKHRVHCFDCGSGYEQSGPHPHCCGSCGSKRIGVHSDSTGEVWAVVLVEHDQTVEAHSIEQSGVGELVQAIINSGLSSAQALVVRPPGTGAEVDWQGLAQASSEATHG